MLVQKNISNQHGKQIHTVYKLLQSSFIMQYAVTDREVSLPVLLLKKMQFGQWDEFSLIFTNRFLWYI